MVDKQNEEAFGLALRAELSRIEEDATVTGKAHFNAADRWSRTHLWIGVPSALLAAAAGASAWKNQPEVAGALALVSGAMTAVLTFLDPKSRHAAHHQAGARSLALRNEARLLRTVELLATPPAALPDLVARVKDIASRYADANAAGPLIPQHAYRRAIAGIAQGQARHAVDQPPPGPAGRPTA